MTKALSMTLSNSTKLQHLRQILSIGLIAALAFFATSSAVTAQDELDALAGDDAADVADDAGNPGAAPGDAGGGAAADTTDSTSDDAANPKAPKNLLAWTFQSLGWTFTILFFALSITLLTLVVMNLIAARQDNICPVDLVEGVEQQLAEGNVAGAAELIRTDDSFLGQVVAAGLSKLEKGHSHAVEAMQEVGEEETMKMEHNLSYMALIGNISPMIGLFGTVLGMIKAFRTIATSGSTPEPGALALDISQALFTTLAGLAIAIPAIAVYNILRNRVQRLTLQVGVTSEEIIERFQ